jgi:hypothetical protein
MKVIQPLTITEDNLISSNLYDVAPALYDAGTTYALGDYVGVAGELGEILIYKSLQASNTGNTPASSPTWWEYSSKTYETYNLFAKYVGVGYRVIDPTSSSIYESLIPYNEYQPLDITATPVWAKGDKTSLTLPDTWAIGTTYTFGQLVYAENKVTDLGTGITTVYENGVFKLTTASSTGTSPFSKIFPNPWEFVPTYPVPYFETAIYLSGSQVRDESDIAYTALRNTKYTALNNPAAWFKIGSSNRMAMFDSQSTTQSIAAKEVIVTIASGIIDTVALINVSASFAEITVRDGLGGTIVFQKTIGLSGGNPANAWDYYFTDPTIKLTQGVVEGIPPFINSHVTIKLTDANTVKIGNVVIGRAKDLGLTTTGSQAGILDFSTKNTDAFGFTTFVQRGYKKTLSVQTEINKADINKVQNTLYSLRATPCLWLSTADPALSEPMVLYGFYKNFSTDISYPTHSLCSLDIEGLI